MHMCTKNRDRGWVEVLLTMKLNLRANIDTVSHNLPYSEINILCVVYTFVCCMVHFDPKLEMEDI
jgi:hypothetical protein